MPTGPEIELSFYEKFFFSKNLEPYQVQEEAFAHIFAGRSVLVTVPTGTGKTVMAKAAIHKALETGQTAVYTTPLRALTEEKYRELVDDFGADKVGFATGDYKINPEAPVQVIVAEILWNRIFGERIGKPADVVIMDEGHYFNEPERGYVWEQSIIGLDPRSQLVILSATVGEPEQFCAWVYQVRKVTMELVKSTERRVPLTHEYRERYLIETVKDLFAAGDYPAIIFTFGRVQCFERARLLKSCPRFTTEEEKARILSLAQPVLLERGVSKELFGYLQHGIGVHHAGVLPRYKQLVEKLTLERLVKFVVSTETISAGINLPAKVVVFPELRKHIQGKARLLLSAEYHQMAGRAGRPQFDTCGLAITLAPEEIVQEVRKEIKDAGKRYPADEQKIWRAAYQRAVGDARKNGDVTWNPGEHAKLVNGAPAPLSSKTKVTPEQILAIGLPDLALPYDPTLPPYMDLNVRTVVANLLLPDRERQAALKLQQQITDNLLAMGVLDEHGKQIAGEIIGKLRGVDGPFVYYTLMAKQLAYEDARALVEFLVDHDAVWKVVTRKDEDKKREWMRARLRERRMAGDHVTWEDVEADYEKEFPRVLTPIEELHAQFTASIPHPELHGGKKAKTIWAQMEADDLGFLDMVEKHDLAYEEGNLFSYLARVMKTAKMLHEVTTLDEFRELEGSVRRKLSVIDERVLEE